MIRLVLAGLLRLVVHDPGGAVLLLGGAVHAWRHSRLIPMGGGTTPLKKQIGRTGHGREDGRLRARPTHPESSGPAGLQRLRLEDGQEALLYVSSRYRPNRPAPLVVTLHGAGGQASGGLAPLLTFADNLGLILLAPSSLGTTWDRIRGDFGADAESTDFALRTTFDRYSVDPSRIAIEGFSDGASYALSLGLTNGDLFTHVIAFSPGFAAPKVSQGKPAIFISHGTGDSVLPIDSCSRRLVPLLTREGYDVTYREFKGGHDIPSDVARQAMDWFLEAKEQTTSRAG